MTYTRETFIRDLSSGKTDFSHEIFPPYTDLSDLQKQGVPLARLQLQHCKFWRVKLSGNTFDGSNCTYADFMHADVGAAHFHSTILTHSCFEDANGSYTDWTSANLEGASLKDAVLTSAKFVNANLCMCDLSGADCTEVDFTGATFTNANIAYVTFRRAVVSREQLEATGRLSWIKSDLLDKCSLAPKAGENLYQLISSGGLNVERFDQRNGFQQVDSRPVVRKGASWNNWPWNRSPFRFFLFGIDFSHNHPIRSLIIEWLEEWRQAPL